MMSILLDMRKRIDMGIFWWQNARGLPRQKIRAQLGRPYQKSRRWTNRRLTIKPKWYVGFRRKKELRRGQKRPNQIKRRNIGRRVAHLLALAGMTAMLGESQQVYSNHKRIKFDADSFLMTWDIGALCCMSNDISHKACYGSIIVYV